MEYVVAILQILIPAGIVFLTAWLLLKRMLDHFRDQVLNDLKAEARKVTIPVRLQAYERMVLLLERINPENLIMRIHRKESSAQSFQLELIAAVRSEFEHNLSQQVYISSTGWEMVKNAKEEILKLINTSMGQLKDGDDSKDLSRVIFEQIMVSKQGPTNEATEYLKQEIRKLF
ncbi:MAG: hypothetical protein KKA07_18250 [Bacteroidetes bacterium]|nr:hypothetical protein [Bacteroidota bacterium]MBU1721013.1 hypothetical protein [Bacteroidota bacterium]